MLGFLLLVAERPHFHINQLRQLTAEIIDVDPCPAVNMRRIFVGEEKGFHACVSGY